MAEPYYEIVLAQTGRTTCSCRKHKIERGQLKLASLYTPSGIGRTWNDTALTCISVTMANAVIDGHTDAGVPILDKTDDLPFANAYLVCKSVVEAIASGTPVSAEDTAFREVTAAKPRVSNKKKREGREAVSARMYPNPFTEMIDSAKVDEAFIAEHPEPSVVDDDFGRRRKATFEAAAAEFRRRWKIEVDMPGPKRTPGGGHVRAVDAVFLTISEAAVMRPRLIEKLSDVWWK
jgi:hypothetical protein